MACALAAGLLLAGCAGNTDDRVTFDGIHFRARADTQGEDRRQFAATVFGASASLDGAREAGRYEGTKYCIENYGTSRIDWAVGPDTDPAQLTVTDNTLTFRGRCMP